MADIRVVIQKPLVGAVGGVQTVTGVNVDNTDPENPVINQDSTKIEATDYATPTTGGTVKVRLDGTIGYFTTNGSDA